MEADSERDPPFFLRRNPDQESETSGKDFLEKVSAELFGTVLDLVHRIPCIFPGVLYVNESAYLRTVIKTKEP